MARTTPENVRQELDVTVEEYPADDAESDLSFATRLVDARIASRLADTAANEDLLTNIETLVAAHLASEGFTNAVQDGRSVSSITTGSAQISYADETRSPGPGGFASTYWGRALTLDPTGRLGVRTRGVSTSRYDADEGH